MKKFINKFLPALYWDVRKQARNFANLAKRYGQFQTIRKWSCLDREGAPIPWYTYPAIEYLSHIEFSSLKVLEYGSGNSTLWWAKRCAELVSIEGNSEWYEKIKDVARTSNKVTYLLEKNEDGYIRQLSTVLAANVVVIDGYYRSQCADWLIELIHDKLHNVAMLIFDNADWYPRTIKALKESLGWIQVDFHGFGPINDYTWTTSIFINPVCHHQITYARPLMSICGLVENSINNSNDSPRNLWQHEHSKSEL